MSRFYGVPSPKLGNTHGERAARVLPKGIFWPSAHKLLLIGSLVSARRVGCEFRLGAIFWLRFLLGVPLVRSAFGLCLWLGVPLVRAFFSEQGFNQKTFRGKTGGFCFYL